VTTANAFRRVGSAMPLMIVGTNRMSVIVRAKGLPVITPEGASQQLGNVTEITIALIGRMRPIVQIAAGLSVIGGVFQTGDCVMELEIVKMGVMKKTAQRQPPHLALALSAALLGAVFLTVGFAMEIMTVVTGPTRLIVRTAVGLNAMMECAFHQDEFVTGLMIVPMGRMKSGARGCQGSPVMEQTVAYPKLAFAMEGTIVPTDLMKFGFRACLGLGAPEQDVA